MIILGTNSIKDTGFNVANSCRFDGADSLQRSKGTQSSLQIGTYSFWIKRTNIDGTQHFVYSNSVDASNKGYYSLRADEKFRIVSDASSGELVLETSQLLRDPTAWMHIVIRIDTTQITAANRCIFYINGVAVTALDTTTYPDQNANLKIFEGGETDKEFIGGMTGETSNLHCYLAEFVFCDGQSLAPTSFGEFDEDSPTIWKAKDVSGLTFGNQGFYLDFEDSSALGNSSNSNNFGTVNNLAATDQSTDTCTNNAIVLNSLAKGANVTLTEGNLQFTSNNRYGTVGTFGLSSGKWYWEVKVVDAGSDIQVGIFQGGGNIGYPNAELGKTSQGWSVISIGGNRLHNLSQSSYGGAAFSDGDILMVALDMDNGKWYMGKNNSWFDSGNPATSSSPAHTGITGTIFPSIATYAESESGSINYQFNFGSPPYAISSGNTDGDGFGNFEYAVPSGYFALCTKNLAEYG